MNKKQLMSEQITKYGEEGIIEWVNGLFHESLQTC